MKPLTDLEKKRCLRLIGDVAREETQRHGVAAPKGAVELLCERLSEFFDAVPEYMANIIRDPNDMNDVRLKEALRELVREPIQEGFARGDRFISAEDS